MKTYIIYLRMCIETIYYECMMIKHMYIFLSVLELNIFEQRQTQTKWNIIDF